jgi:hypothetical protein
VHMRNRNSIRMSVFGQFMARLGVLVCFVAVLSQVGWAQTAPTLGTAQSFGVFAAAAVSNTGSSTVHGDLGLSPNGPTSITGISGSPTPGQVIAPGTIHAADAVALQARNDIGFAYDSLGTQASTKNLTGVDLGGHTYTAGVYDFSSSAQLTGTVTLNGTANSVFIFRMGSTLTTASASTVKLTGGAQACNVFWKVGSSATLGTATSFIGTILADTSITLTTGASVNGRVLAGAKTLSGAVTLDTNNIFFSSCAPGTTNGGDIPGAGPGPTGTPNTPPVSAPPAVCTDTIKPSIGNAFINGGERFTIRDTGSGLGSIFFELENEYFSSPTPAFLPVGLPVFVQGTTAAVVVWTNPINPNAPFGISLTVTDLCGNKNFYDPAGLRLTKTRGGPDTVTVTGIARVEHFIDIANGTPGLDNLSISVNGEEVWSRHVSDGQTGTINIGPEMNSGDDNTITFDFRGQAGDSAKILIRPAND